MAIPTIIKSTDVGAPTLDGDNGSMYNVLKWALPQLGWTIEHDDSANSVIAFRNNANTGTGTYFEVIDNSSLTFNSNGSICSLRAYENMTAPLTGDMVIGNPFGMEIGFIKSTRVGANSADPVDYQIIGTDKQFYIINSANVLANLTMRASGYAYVGDINAYNPNDHKRFMISGTIYNTDVPFRSNITIATPPVCESQATPAFSSNGAIMSAGNYIGTRSTDSVVFYSSSFPACKSSNAVISFLSGGVNNTRDPGNSALKTAYCVLIDAVDLVYRGVMPGLLISLNNIVPSYSPIYQPNNLFERKFITPNGKYANCVMQVGTSFYRQFGESDGVRYMMIFNVEEDWDTLI